MGYAKHVGRVGALAVALGIGAAVATTPGVAWAEGPDDPGVEAPGDPGGTPKDPGTPGATTPSTEHGDPGEAIRRNIERAADGIRNAITGVVRSSGGAITSTHRTGSNSTNGNVPPVIVEENDLPESPQQIKQKSTTFVQNNDTSPVGSFTPPRWHAPQGQVNTNPAPKPVAKAIDDVKDVVQQSINAVTGNQSATGSTAIGRNAFSTLDSLDTVDQQQVRTGFVAPIAIITNVVNAALAPFLNPTPGQPAPQNPILWAVLGFVRRQFQDTPFGKVVLNRTPDITTPDVVDNHDGTFTITPSADDVDPDGDNLTYSAGNGTDGTVVKNDDGTFTYTVDAVNWDKSDTITLTASDEGAYPHVHGLAGLFSPGGGHTDSVTVTIAPDDGSLPPPPDVVVKPTERNDGSGNFDTVLQYNPATVADVKAAPGFEPKYWTVVEEHYDETTGKYTAVLKPTQAGALRAGLGLDTTDQLKLNVTPQPTGQTFALRSASFAALAAEDPPDQALNLPTPPAAHLQVDDPAIPVGSHPAGVVVTDKYAYVINAYDGTVSVIGADPNDAATYNKVLDMDTQDGEDDIDPLAVGQSPFFGSLSGGNLYVVNAADGTVSVIDTATNTLVDTDENDGQDDIDPIVVEPGAFNSVASPDGKRLYVISQAGHVFVVDTDPTSENYNKVVDLDPATPGNQGISTAPPPDNNPDDGQTSSGSISGALSADGSRLYVTRSYTTVVQGENGNEYVFGPGDVVVIDTASNAVIGDPIELQQYPGYASSNGKRIYMTSLNGDDIRNLLFDQNAPPPPGYVTVVDIDPNSPTYNTEIDQIEVGKYAVNVAMSPDGSLAYVVNAGDGTVSVIDTATDEVLTTFTYDPSPSGQFGDASLIAISPDGNRLYVSRFLDGQAAAISIVPGSEAV